MKFLDFMKIALRDYEIVGAPAPSSHYIIERIISGFPPNPELVIEYGPGSGVITEEILKILPENGKLIVIEIKDEFVSQLKKINDPRLSVIAGDVFTVLKDVSRFGIFNESVHAIISGIPFLVWPENQKARDYIFRRSSELLRQGGTFSFYQSSPFLSPELKKYFRKIRKEFEPRNLMPYFVVTAEK